MVALGASTGTGAGTLYGKIGALRAVVVVVVVAVYSTRRVD